MEGNLKKVEPPYIGGRVETADRRQVEKGGGLGMECLLSNENPRLEKPRPF